MIRGIYEAAQAVFARAEAAEQFRKDHNYVISSLDLNSTRPDAHRADETDALFESGLKVQLYHIPSKSEVAFKAFLTDFSDQFQQSWNEEQVFGRSDPHQVFKNTKRVINIGWTVLATDLSEAKENMRKMSSLAQMQYPTYNSAVQGDSNVGIMNANAIQASPVFKLKFMNWIQDVNAGTSPTSTAKESGLVGKMDGFNFEPNLDVGVFCDRDGSIYPKELKVSISFTALHTHDLGWKGEHARKARFPYGEDLSQKTPYGRKPIKQYKPSKRDIKKESTGLTVEQYQAIANKILEDNTWDYVNPASKYTNF